MPLSNYGKELIASAELKKGHAFLAAAILLDREITERGQNDRESLSYVELHLICQGIELILKSALLYKDFHRYANPKTGRKKSLVITY